MIKGIYTLREDGDWDFYAAFNDDSALTDFSPLVIKGLEQGETVKVVEFDDLSHVVDVLTIPRRKKASAL